MDYVRKETNAESFSIEFYFFQLMGKLNSWAPDQSARCFFASKMRNFNVRISPLEYGIIIENCKSESLMLNLRQLIDPLMHRIPYFIRIYFLINTCNCIFNLFN